MVVAALPEMYIYLPTYPATSMSVALKNKELEI